MLLLCLSLGFVLFAAVWPASGFSWCRECTEPLVGEEKSQLSSGVFNILVKIWIFVCFSLSLRYQKAAEEATAEKKRSVSVLYKCLFAPGTPAWMLLWQLIFGVWTLLLCVLQKTWLRHRVCFCFTLCFFPVWRKEKEMKFLAQSCVESPILS